MFEIYTIPEIHLYNYLNRISAVCMYYRISEKV